MPGDFVIVQQRTLTLSILPVSVELQIKKNVILELTKWQIKPSVSSMVAFHGHSHFHKHWACTEQMLVLKMNFYHVRECLHCGFPDNHSIACCLYSQIHPNILVSIWYCLTSVPNEIIKDS